METSPSLVRSINRWFDLLPRTRLGARSREVPAFLACGVTGYHLAVLVTVAVGLATGGSVLIIASIAASCVLSFLAWAALRRRLLGRDELVLLEHAWFALLVTTGALRATGVPPLRYLDATSVGMAVFLASGRVGCLLVGCCHGRPSSIGIRYGEEHVHDGFPARWAHVRLFPVQALESAGLWAIAVVGAGMAVRAPAGVALAWFLSAYAVMRFGLEGLRGDERPHWIGLSQARWMGLGELAVAFALSHVGRAPAARGLLVPCAVVGVAVAAVARWLWRDSTGHDLLDPAHIREVREQALSLLDDADGAAPLAQLSSEGLSIAASRVKSVDGRPCAHVSLSLPDGARDLPTLCRVAASAFPSAPLEHALLSPPTLLHLLVPLPIEPEEGPGDDHRALDLEAAVLRRLDPVDRENENDPTGGPASIRRSYFLHSNGPRRDAVPQNPPHTS
ncbi:MAG: hypothetical protein JWM10_360 [Myxococcaceae bacterium]|nr:hypothetical protein [Myxococcaceae bacterium]